MATIFTPFVGQNSEKTSALRLMEKVEVFGSYLCRTPTVDGGVVRYAEAAANSPDGLGVTGLPLNRVPPIFEVREVALHIHGRFVHSPS